MPVDCTCPMCGQKTSSEANTVYMVATYNPTLPYSNEVFEYICKSCNQQWFLK